VPKARFIVEIWGIEVHEGICGGVRVLCVHELVA
jgi:hypothetical protein